MHFAILPQVLSDLPSKNKTFVKLSLTAYNMFFLCFFNNCAKIFIFVCACDIICFIRMVEIKRNVLLAIGMKTVFPS